MDRSDVIYLVSTSHTQDANGIWQETETQRKVFCQVDSVTASEFFEGGRNGLNPEYRIRMFAPDYEGERYLVYNGNGYTIYRTYVARDDTIELYVERQAGSNGKGSS